MNKKHPLSILVKDYEVQKEKARKARSTLLRQYTKSNNEPRWPITASLDSPWFIYKENDYWQYLIEFWDYNNPLTAEIISKVEQRGLSAKPDSFYKSRILDPKKHFFRKEDSVLIRQEEHKRFLLFNSELEVTDSNLLQHFEVCWGKYVRSTCT
jgi:hypothetical protein